DHYGRAEAIVFAVGVITSTWLIVVSRNLYWVSWTWFLPMLVNGLLLLNRPISPKRWKLVYVAAAVTLLVKSLCGYEYLTSIVIMA
ncbi:hypothetical protein, partial [Klebsiella variicola]|uniref:hypothetical protein n=2 Tax=Pseudomonadota TaxID=1224 RepID=UPI0027317AC2